MGFCQKNKGTWGPICSVEFGLKELVRLGKPRRFSHLGCFVCVSILKCLVTARLDNDADAVHSCGCLPLL
jgi:hypothetical protein